jgi:hypothetical protein
VARAVAREERRIAGTASLAREDFSAEVESFRISQR